MLINKCHREERSIFLDEENRYIPNSEFNEEILYKYGEQVRQAFPELQKDIRRIQEMDQPYVIDKKVTDEANSKVKKAEEYLQKFQ